MSFNKTTLIKFFKINYTKSYQLTDGTTITFFKDWLLKEEGIHTSGNSFYLFRKNPKDKKIIVGFLFPDDEDDPDEIEVDKQQLINLIDKWQELTSKNIEKIYLIKDNDNIYLTEELPNF